MTREYLHTQSPSNVSAVCGSGASLLSPIQYKERRETMDEAWDIFDSFQSGLTSPQQVSSLMLTDNTMLGQWSVTVPRYI